METRLTACFKQCLLRGHFVPQQQHFFTSVYYFLALGNCILTLKIWSCDKQMSAVTKLSTAKAIQFVHIFPLLPGRLVEYQPSRKSICLSRPGAVVISYLVQLPRGWSVVVGDVTCPTITVIDVQR
ncbi:hypothetical protein T02_2548 [Trichinella nativa]|uniref:Uncharacterized protein n=1 Tax=Trichinella nativa TaxID=6335 RepID=A0A0V1LRW9_9BILA|nr:hypothetical protein T02_2548 [Trichinella nativa]